MGKKTPLSKGELEVAKTLWSLGSSTVREVYEAMARERDIEFATVQTYLRRLAVKGYVSTKLVGRTRHYAPKVQANRVIRDTVGDLVDRLFGGDVLPLVRHLVQDRDITRDEIKELRRLIDEWEETSNDP